MVTQKNIFGALTKYQRACHDPGLIDPVSGFSAREIEEWLAENVPSELRGPVAARMRRIREDAGLDVQSRA